MTTALSTMWDGYNCAFIYLLVVLTSLSLTLPLWINFLPGFVSLISFLKFYLSCVRVPSAVLSGFD